MYRYSRFSLFASRVARTLGHPITFMIFLGAALLWLATGPLFHFSGNWYSAYSNTATIVTTLLLFLIQHTQSREIASIQFKLNEIIRVSEGAHNSLLDIEEMTDRDYDRIKASYTALARQAREQLQSGKVKWATARVSMESLDSFLDSTLADEENTLKETSKETVVVKANNTPREFPSWLASSLERMTRVVAHSGHAPMALIAVNTNEHTWLQKQVGFDSEPNDVSPQGQTPLAQFLVAQVVSAKKIIIVPDTSEQPLPSGVTSARITAFLVIPLIGAHHQIIGCLAVLDTQPRQWRDTEVAALQDMAALTVEQVSKQAVNVSTPPEAQTVGNVTAEAASSKTAIPFAAPATAKGKGSGRRNADSIASDDAGTPTSGTILVVDDSATNRTLLQRRLEREGYRVVVAGNGQEALECLQTEAVGLILLDVMMPEMDGEEVLQQMQNSDRLREIPVIMVTALDEQASVERCLKAGAKDYVLKPIDPVQLRTQVHAYLPPSSIAEEAA